MNSIYPSYARLIQNDHTLTRFSSSNWPAEMAEPLAKAIELNCTIKKLNIDYPRWVGSDRCNYSSKVAKPFVEAIAVNYTITNLQVSFSKAIYRGFDKNKGVVAIATMLKLHRTITSFSLSCGDDEKEGIVELAKSLEVNRTITKLKLLNLGSDETSDNIGALAIAKMLEINQTITTCKLEGFGKKVKTIAESLKNNRTITKLELSPPHTIGFEGILAIAAMLKVNHTITDLDFGALSPFPRSGALSVLIQNRGLPRNVIEQLATYNGFLSRYRSLEAFSCAQAGQKEKLAELLKKGVLINGIGPTENAVGTLLHAAVLAHQTHIVSFLLEEGADKEIKYKDKTPLDKAREKGFQDIIDIIALLEIEEKIAKLIESLQKQEARQDFMEEASAEQVEGIQKDMKTLQTQLEGQISTLLKDQKSSQEATAILQNELCLVKEQQRVLSLAHEVKKAKKDAIESFNQAPNLIEFYVRMQTRLEALFFSAKSAAGGLTVVEPGKPGKVAEKIELFGDFIGLAPIAGSLVDKFLKVTVVQLLNCVDGKRQKNRATNIANLATWASASKEIESAVRLLTKCYTPQLKKLAPPSVLGLKAKADKKVVNKIPISRAEKVAEFGALWVYEAIQEGSTQEGLSLSQIILSSIFSKRPLEGNQSFKDNQSVKEKIKEQVISVKEIIEHLSSKTVKINEVNAEGKYLTWTLRDLYTKPPIQTEEGELWGAAWTDSGKYGYSSGTRKIATERGLKTSMGENVAVQKLILKQEKDQRDQAMKIDLIQQTLLMQLGERNKVIYELQDALKDEKQERKKMEAEMEARLKVVEEMLSKTKTDK